MKEPELEAARADSVLAVLMPKCCCDVAAESENDTAIAIATALSVYPQTKKLLQNLLRHSLSHKAIAEHTLNVASAEHRTVLKKTRRVLRDVPLLFPHQMLVIDCLPCTRPPPTAMRNHDRVEFLGIYCLTLLSFTNASYPASFKNPAFLLFQLCARNVNIGWCQKMNSDWSMQREIF